MEMSVTWALEHSLTPKVHGGWIHVLMTRKLCREQRSAVW